MENFIADTDSKWIGCYFAVRHSEYEYVKDKVMIHCTGQYILSKEIAPLVHKQTAGEHIHVLAEMTAAGYHKLCKNIKDKYKLQGRAKDGNAKQYGRTEKIRDLKRYKAYCIKDGDYETNINDIELKELKEISFVKESREYASETKPRKKPKAWMQQVVDELLETYPDKLWDMRLETEFNVLRNFMFDRLGDSAKAFDKVVFNRLFIGILNKLPKTQRQREDFREKMSSDIRDMFVLY